MAYPSTVKTGSVTVLVPAHDEAGQIEDTLVSLLSQTRPPDEIVVIADNCTDATIPIALAYAARGVTVIETSGNQHKKAGALNAGMRYLTSRRVLPEFLVTIDADTILDRHFLARAITVMNRDRRLGGLSAVCTGKPIAATVPQWSDSKNALLALMAWIWAAARTALSRGLLWAQRAEYARAGVMRLRFNVHTLSGAGSVLRTHAVLDVLAHRGALYDERHDNLVEDYEATLEIKRHGWRCTNNYHCVARTDLMPTLSTLLRQRIRWVRGSVDELRRRGIRRETRASIGALALAYLGIPLFYWWIYELTAKALAGDLRWQSLPLIGLVALYQAFTLRRMGWRSMAVGLLLVPELLFNIVRHAWLLSSLGASMFSRRHEWE